MKRGQKFLIPLAMLACVALTNPAHGGSTLDRIRSSGVLVIAHRDASVPFSYVDVGGRPIGYAIELCERLALSLKRRLNLPSLQVKFVQVSIADRIAALTEGRADLECGSTTNTAERRERVSFTIPHFVTGTRYLVRADSDFELLNQFHGKRMVSTRDTAPLNSIRKVNHDFMLGINIIEADDHNKALRMVENREADGFAMDEILLRSLIATRPDPAMLKVVGKFLTIEALAIAMSKEDAEFKRLIDDEMRELIFSKEVERIYDRWFQRPIPPIGVNLKVPPNYLLRDYWKHPTAYVP